MTIMDREDDNLVKSSKKKKVKNNQKKQPIKNKDVQIQVNKKVKKKKQHLFFYKILSFIIIVLTVITLVHFTLSETLSIFYIIPIALCSLIVVGIIAFILNRVKLRKWIKNIFSIFTVIIIIFEVLMLLYGTRTLKFLSNITDTGYRVETFGVYVLNDSDYHNLSDIEGVKLNYLKHDDDKNIVSALKKIKKEVHLQVNYNETSKELLDSLIDEKVEAILMDTSYESILEEEYKEDYSKIRLLKEVDIVDVIDTIKSDVNITKDPFVVYISGIDTSGNVASKARSDVNILIGVNPNTHNILLVNTPRDYYVTLHTKKKKDKLTHAGLSGVEESLKTLSDLYDVDIDYYARINFTSFVKIVNALEGIKVNVPIGFCEQNSKRSKRPGDLICLSQGMQTLNGEQALALARHRHTLPTGDRGRGENQMLVLQAVINKAMSPKILTKYNALINALEGRVSTNMTTNEMINFAKKQVSKKANWNFTKLSANGKDSKGVCAATGSGKAYVMQPDMESIFTIQDAFSRLFDGEEELIVKEEIKTSNK